jgi:putative oxidoreductase
MASGGIKNVFKTGSTTGFQAWALLFMRLIAGIGFMLHGWGKIQNPFAWMPESSPVPGIFQFLAAFSEFGGGLALTLGLLTPLALSGLIVTMIVAVLFHGVMLGDPFVNTTGTGGSYEPALSYLGIFIVLFATGPGNWSLDQKFFGTKD